MIVEILGKVNFLFLDGPDEMLGYSISRNAATRSRTAPSL